MKKGTDFTDIINNAKYSMTIDFEKYSVNYSKDLKSATIGKPGAKKDKIQSVKSWILQGIAKRYGVLPSDYTISPSMVHVVFVEEYPKDGSRDGLAPETLAKEKFNSGIYDTVWPYFIFVWNLMDKNDKIVETIQSDKALFNRPLNCISGCKVESEILGNLEDLLRDSGQNMDRILNTIGQFKISKKGR